MDEKDILIIGAGPSGATASISLSKMGIDHTIVDAAVFPRDKICGDGLDLKVVRVLRHLDPDLVEQVIPNDPHFLPTHGVRFTMPRRSVVDFVHTDSPLVWTSKRQYFDDFLVKRIESPHARFLPGVRVRAIERDGDRRRVYLDDGVKEWEMRPRLILAADGEKSVMLRHLGERAIQRRHYAASLRQYWSGVKGFDPRNLIEMYFPKGYPMSYFYMFPLPGGAANVGYGMVSEVLSQRRLHLRELFQRLIQEDPVLAPRFEGAQPLEPPQGWGLPLATRRRRAFGDGYLLLGDAASLISPTSGEGIGAGMMSGYIAAHFTRAALKSGSFGAEQFKNYDREIYRRLQSEIRWHNILRRVPVFWYDRALDWFTPSPAFQWFFNSRVKGWIHTAYEKEIEVAV